MGQNVIHCGDHGMGEVVKVVNNLIAGVLMAVVAEAYNIGIRAGADPQVMYDVISKSSGSCWAHDRNNPIPGILPGFASHQRLRAGLHGRPDAQGSRARCSPPRKGAARAPAVLAAVAEQVFASASNIGHGRSDMSAVLKAVEALSGTPDAAPPSV